MKITIAGYGYVGKAYNALLKDYDITIVDPKLGDNRVSPDTDAVIICVATPQSDDGTCNMKNVFDVMSDIPIKVPVLIKSTISLDGWKELNEKYSEHMITFSPEYLRAATAVHDVLNTNMMYFSNTGKPLFWHNVFKHSVYDFKGFSGSAEELILGKYFRNSFLAMKVAFFNQVFDLCDVTGIDYEAVAAHIGSDRRIGYSHTTVTPDRGFGGHCFPKDTSAIVETAKRHNVELTLIEEAIQYNKKIRLN
jgi:UDPglucose 6-dehydrogenase